MPIKVRRFVGQLLVITTLVACTPALVDREAKAATPAHHEHDTLPLPKRLAFMAGHVEAGLALYRAGEPAMAAPHLLHPVSETHASERVGLDALGFDGALFVAVSQALDEGRPASEIESQLAAAEANLAEVARRGGGETIEIIDYLMDTVLEEYAIGVPAQTVTDMGEYQDAFGFTVVAIDRANQMPSSSARDQLISKLQGLLALWPEAPIPPAQPTRLRQVEQQVNQVKDALQKF